jgi:hypothetical protein
MDPLGFALENYDAIGQWRTQDGSFPIDNSGALPDGRKVQGPNGLKAVLKCDQDAFTRCLTGKLLTYALGRGLEPSDQPAVHTITRHVAEDDYRCSRLVLEIVSSPLFQMRSGESEVRPGTAKARNMRENAKSDRKESRRHGRMVHRIKRVSPSVRFALSRTKGSLWDISQFPVGTFPHRP